MKFIIKHDIRGRLRIHMVQSRMSYEEADTLLYYIENLSGVTSAKVFERTCDASISYKGDRETLLQALRIFQYQTTDVPADLLAHSGRELNSTYQEKLVQKVVLRAGSKLFLPYPIRAAYAAFKSLHYIWKGLRCLAGRKLEVEVLDATAIGVSVLRADFDTASSIMFLLGIGELLEEWTHKKSVDDLARSMSLNVSKVWLKKDDQEILVSSKDIKPGDEVIVRMGNVIPFDGIVCEGEATVNQASLTGESEPVRKDRGTYVYAGTVLEEGELTIQVKAISGSTRFEKIVTVIEDSEKLKSGVESKAESLADRLVPYTLGGTVLTWLLTRNATKALAVLMVDFSCALKLAMPISVLSAIREAQSHHITVKGGKFLEAVSAADTIVFDKTGTLTKAKPTVVDVVAFDHHSKDELLRIAACLEEHFPHSMAKAVVLAAKNRQLDHEEMHSKVNYIVAHGISTSIDDHKVIIGSHHFVFEDEGCVIPEDQMKKFQNLPTEYSHLYMAIDNQLAAVICIEDPLRPEAADAVRALKAAGIRHVVMMTGDSDRTARAIAAQVGVDRCFAEVLPEDKAAFVRDAKAAGHTVVMIGDGINDSPALSAADIGIAIHSGAAIAREIADVTIRADSLEELVTLKAIANALQKRVGSNYRFVLSFNSALILLGALGILPPATSAMLHNLSTLGISLRSMTDLLEQKPLP